MKNAKKMILAAVLVLAAAAGQAEARDYVNVTFGFGDWWRPAPVVVTRHAVYPRYERYQVAERDDCRHDDRGWRNGRRFEERRVVVIDRDGHDRRNHDDHRRYARWNDREDD